MKVNANNSFRVFLVLIAVAMNLLVSAQQEKPNIVFIVADDMNQYMGALDFYEMAVTPNLDELAANGTLFTNAHSNAPVCAPSRASFFTGIYPHTSGNFFFDNWRNNEILHESKTIMEHLGDNGYVTAGAGKLMHKTWKGAWDEYGLVQDYTPMAYNGNEHVGHPSVPEPFRSIGPLDASFARLSDIPNIPAEGENPGYNGWYLSGGFDEPFRYVSEEDRDRLPDERYVDWALDKLEFWDTNDPGEPFFLGVGLIRPHTPLVVPDRFYDMFPIEEIVLPPILENDADDTFFEAQDTSEPTKGRSHYTALVNSYESEELALKTYLQAYLASVAFMDEQVGRILDWLEASRFGDNTIVVFTSDHGYTIGEKDHLFKGNLWESTTRVPLIIYDPRREEQTPVVDEVASLIDIFPTLADLGGVTADNRKSEKGRLPDGVSLVPLLDGDNSCFSNAYALSVVQGVHYSIKDKDFRYILYQNGDEEFYDQQEDRNDLTNLASDEEYEPTMEAYYHKLQTILDPNYIESYEFEDGTLIGQAEIVTTCASASRGAFVKLSNTSANAVSFNDIEIGEAGLYTLDIFYYGANEVPFTLEVNGAESEYTVPAADWCFSGPSALFTIEVSLVAGTNTLLFRSTGEAHAPLLDKLKITNTVAPAKKKSTVNLSVSKVELSAGEECLIEAILDTVSAEPQLVGLTLSSESPTPYSISSESITIYRNTLKGKSILKFDTESELTEDYSIQVSLNDLSEGLELGENASATITLKADPDDPEEPDEVLDTEVNQTQKLFPNPVHDRLNFDFESAIRMVKVSDLAGREYAVRRSGESLNSFDVGHLEHGVYVVTVTTAEGSTFIDKFVKE